MKVNTSMVSLPTVNGQCHRSNDMGARAPVLYSSVYSAGAANRENEGLESEVRQNQHWSVSFSALVFSVHVASAYRVNLCSRITECAMKKNILTPASNSYRVNNKLRATDTNTKGAVCIKVRYFVILTLLRHK